MKGVTILTVKDQKKTVEYCTHSSLTVVYVVVQG
jgi:hypothetical protein